MATLDDKILGEKLQNYCSSSESSEDEAETDEKNGSGGNTVGCDYSTSRFGGRCLGGAAVNTGPKGVLQDWQRYKQLESEKREEKEAEKLKLIKNLSLTCSSKSDEDNLQDDEDKELSELLEADFMQQYMEQRMAQMYKQLHKLPSFGSVITLKNSQEFLDAIDNVSKDVVVMIHLYEEGIPSCDAMNGCLSCIAQDYRHVKFCKLKASAAGVSSHFKSAGIPALLVYKNGQMLGNFVGLHGEFGEDFFASDVEVFLIEHGMLTDKSLVPSIIRDGVLNGGSDAGFE